MFIWFLLLSLKKLIVVNSGLILWDELQVKLKSPAPDGIQKGHVFHDQTEVKDLYEKAVARQ